VTEHWCDRITHADAAERAQILAQAEGATHVRTCAACRQTLRVHADLRTACAGLSPDAAALGRMRAAIADRIGAGSPVPGAPTAGWPYIVFLSAVVAGLVALIAWLSWPAGPPLTTTPTPPIVTPNSSASVVLAPSLPMAMSATRPALVGQVSAPVSATVELTGAIRRRAHDGSVVEQIVRARDHRMSEPLDLGPDSHLIVRFPRGFAITIAGQAAVRTFTASGLEVVSASATFAFARHGASPDAIRAASGSEPVMQITTPRCVITVVGTTYVLHVSGDQERCMVVEGAVEVCRRDGRLLGRLAPRQGVVVTATGPCRLETDAASADARGVASVGTAVPVSLTGDPAAGDPAAGGPAAGGQGVTATAVDTATMMRRLDDGF